MLFSKDMTYPEAVKALFKATEGKTEEEKRAIMEEYKKILPEITDRELKEPACMTGYVY